MELTRAALTLREAFHIADSKSLAGRLMVIKSQQELQLSAKSNWVFVLLTRFFHIHYFHVDFQQ